VLRRGVWIPDKPNQFTLELQNGLKVIYRTPSKLPSGSSFHSHLEESLHIVVHIMSFSVQMYQCKTNFLLLTGCTQSTVKEQD
jgi:hypothetical protein